MKCNLPGAYTKGRKHLNSKDRQLISQALTNALVKRDISFPQEMLPYATAIRQETWRQVFLQREVQLIAQVKCKRERLL